ncbi:MAG: DMT family transporter [Anaerolineae bacterium]
MAVRPLSHTRAVLLALFVTLLWSTSWVLIKIGLQDLPALTFAGLRYSLAFVILLGTVLARRGLHGLIREVRALPPRLWPRLVVLGLLFYTITQGAQFVALDHAPAMTVSLLLNFSALVVAGLGVALLRERPTPLQWIGAAISLAGAVLYFYPVDIPSGQMIGLAAAVTAMLATSFSSLLGRAVNRAAEVDPLVVTVISMGIGSIPLLAGGVLTQGLPALDLSGWLIVGWLAAVNTALAFTLWNRTLQVLPAVESSILNNTMLIQIAVLAWVFLGERISGQGIAGLALAAVGTLIVQVYTPRRTAAAEEGAV